MNQITKADQNNTTKIMNKREYYTILESYDHTKII